MQCKVNGIIVIQRHVYVFDDDMLFWQLHYINNLQKLVVRKLKKLTNQHSFSFFRKKKKVVFLIFSNIYYWMKPSIRQLQYFIELLTFKMICGQLVFSRIFFFFFFMTYSKIYVEIDANLQLVSEKNMYCVLNNLFIDVLFVLTEKTIAWPYFILNKFM